MSASRSDSRDSAVLAMMEDEERRQRNKRASKPSQKEKLQASLAAIPLE